MFSGRGTANGTRTASYAPVMPSLPAPPADALARLVPADIDLGPLLVRPAHRPVWFGIVWGRLGRGDLAWAFWDSVSSRPIGDIQPWIAGERGRVLRELGLHAEAERIEWPALAIATDPVVDAMLRISLTADAVGRGEVDAVIRRFAAAEQWVVALDDSPRAARQRLRLAWVDVEVAAMTRRPPRHGDLLPDDPRTGTGTGGGLPAIHDLGTDFHRAKSLLFASATAATPVALALLDAARALAPPVLMWAIELARADRDVPGALEAARRAWSVIVPPPGFEAVVAATPTAQRLAGRSSGLLDVVGRDVLGWR